MKRLVLGSAILAVLAILGAFPVAFATHSTPFKGSFSGSFAFVSPTKVTITGTGHFAHLGKTTFANTAIETGSAACEGGLTATEHDTFTAANGDEVFSSATDVVCPTSNPSVVQVTASFTITGGTGRFADASGSGTTQLSAVMTSMTAGTLSGTTTGTITY